MKMILSILYPISVMLALYLAIKNDSVVLAILTSAFIISNTIADKDSV